MTAIKLIRDVAELERLIFSAAKEDWVALDTEFMREKTYFPLLCLVQVKTRSDEFCIDALAVGDLSAVKSLLINPAVAKILHACGQDLEALNTDSGQVVFNLDDTQVAAAFCGFDLQISYAELTRSVCGVALSKSHTRANWAERPLSGPQLQYAIDDVRYLGDIAGNLRGKLSAAGKLSWYENECERIARLNHGAVNPEDAWRRLKGGAHVPVDLQAGAKALAIWRERQAQQRNLPREWVLKSRYLIEISRRRPASHGSLSQIEGLSEKFIRRHGDDVLRILREAASLNEPLVWRKKEALSAAQRKRAKAVKVKLDSLAGKLEMNSALLGTQSDIEAYVRGAKDAAFLNGWRFEAAGRYVMNL